MRDAMRLQSSVQHFLVNPWPGKLPAQSTPSDRIGMPPSDRIGILPIIDRRGMRASDRMGVPTKDQEDYHFIYDKYQSLFRLMRGMGVFPLHKEPCGVIRLDLRSAAAVYSMALLGAVELLSLFTAYMVLTTAGAQVMEYSDKLLYCTCLTLALFHPMAIVSFLEAGKLASFLNDCKHLQVRLESMTGRKFSRTASHGWVLVYVVALVGTCAFFAITGGSYLRLFARYGLHLPLHCAFLTTQFYCSVAIANAGYSWLVYTRAIQSSAETLLASIESLAWAASGSLQEHLLLWLNLRQLCVKLGGAQSLLTLYSCAAMFLTALPYVYMGAFKMSEGDYSQILPAFNTLVYISFLAEMAHRAVDKLGPQFEMRLTELLLSGRAAGCEGELIRFLQVMAASPPRISPASYFTLDRSLNLPLYSSMVTYLMIIIQFQPRDGN